MPLPGVRARRRRSDPASVESGGPAVWAPPSGCGGASPGPAEAGQGAMQAVCAKCSRLMCRAVVLFLVAECAQTTPMIAPLPGDPNFSVDGSVAFFKSGESNPTQPSAPPEARGRPPLPQKGPLRGVGGCGWTCKPRAPAPPATCSRGGRGRRASPHERAGAARRPSVGVAHGGAHPP